MVKINLRRLVRCFALVNMTPRPGFVSLLRREKINRVRHSLPRGMSLRSKRFVAGFEPSLDLIGSFYLSLWTETKHEMVVVDFSVSEMIRGGAETDYGASCCFNLSRIYHFACRIQQLNSPVVFHSIQEDVVERWAQSVRRTAWTIKFNETVARNRIDNAAVRKRAFEFNQIWLHYRQSTKPWFRDAWIDSDLPCRSSKKDGI